MLHCCASGLVLTRRFRNSSMENNAEEDFQGCFRARAGHPGKGRTLRVCVGQGTLSSALL